MNKLELLRAIKEVVQSQTDEDQKSRKTCLLAALSRDARFGLTPLPVTEKASDFATSFRFFCANAAELNSRIGAPQPGLINESTVANKVAILDRLIAEESK